METRKKSKILVLTVLTLLHTLPLLYGLAYADSSIITNPDNGHRYQRIDTKMTWHDAKVRCETLRGHLATITSDSENIFVYDNLVKSVHSSADCWLGGTDETTEGVWQWITGEPWSYTNWQPGEPNNQGNEDYLGYFSAHADYKWNDTNDTFSGSNAFPICEWSGPALSFTLIGCCTYRVGDRFTVQARVTNPEARDVPIEVKAGVRFPDGMTTVNVLGNTHLEVTLPASLDTTVTILDITLPQGIPTGTWKFEGTLLGPNLGETLSREVVPFVVEP